MDPPSPRTADPARAGAERGILLSQSVTPPGAAIGSTCYRYQAYG